MSLIEYLKKRDFKQTTEPRSGKSTEKALSFVVQRHYASHLHYDFRLELDGVLKSWAIPKGPSMDSDDKRLALMVEDHPVAYGDFEGIIPRGNYGAGVVFIWDKGFYRSVAEDRGDDAKTLRSELESGTLEFSLNGKILKGGFTLVKMHNREDNAWLLIKHNDEYAVKSFDPEDFVPEGIKALKNNKNGKATALPAI
ncbi:MAG TPA: 3'-phosphoesterase [Mucilaginibacter sp.]|jgi:bifunctional non-homologous end joining protein LigD|nr:3'-phosphoesterase [Mucilaginibacter sp.]